MKRRLIHDTAVVVNMVMVMMVYRVWVMMILQWRRLYRWHHRRNASLTLLKINYSKIEKKNSPKVSLSWLNVILNE